MINNLNPFTCLICKKEIDTSITQPTPENPDWMICTTCSTDIVNALNDKFIPQLEDPEEFSCERCKGKTKEDLCNLVGDLSVAIGTIEAYISGELKTKRSLEEVVIEALQVLKEAREYHEKTC